MKIGKRIVLLSTFASVAMAGVVTGTLLWGREGTAHSPGPWASTFPDDRVDVCVQAMGGAAPASLSAVSDALDVLEGKRVGRSIKLAEIERVVTADCALEPPVHPDKGQTLPDDRAYRYVKPADAAPFDLVLYAYPEEVAARLGDAWDERETPQEWILLPNEDPDQTDEVYAIGAQAVFVGENEFRDPALLLRLVAEGLGLAGPGNPLRPYIDGRCIERGNPECGDEIPAP